MPPSFGIHLEPLLHEGILIVGLSISGVNVATNKPIFWAEAKYTNVLGQASTLQARDSSDSLTILRIPSDAALLHYPQLHPPPQANVWVTSRNTKGTIFVTFQVHPAHWDQGNSDIGTEELCWDEHGLVGVGRTFLPQPIGDTIDTNWRITLDWNLGSWPEGTRGVWTFGEGPGMVEVAEGRAESIGSSIFMVGPIHSFPNAGQHRCWTYWFGDLPDFLENIRVFNLQMFNRASQLFKDDKTVYRVFFRASNSKFEGVRCTRSYLLEFVKHGDLNKPSYEELANRMAREMMHNWIWMWPEATGYQNRWFAEG